MNNRFFDLDLLKTLVMVVDCSSFTVAASRLHSTQSTVSQKIRRLEAMAGHRLLERGHRDIQPTDAGETVLGYARRMLSLNDEMLDVLAGEFEVTIRLGLPEDFASGRRTTHVLSTFNRRHPRVKLEVTSGLSRDLSKGFDQGELDLVIVKQRRHSREAVACWPERLCWIDSAEAPSCDRDPIPLVAFPPRGLYRDDMIQAMERLGRRWRISFTSSSLSGIQAAVADGMGVSLLPARAVTNQHVIVTGHFGATAVDTMEVVILHRPRADAMVKELAGFLIDMLEQDLDER
ncbi:LysR family transcriptional regulator [Halomonas organivorans]|uniref:DNA-binding transcriptional LysR family regulator n=1 Tax=Halomonas organivorans TaxID=257772 RepID=A0A7W5BZC9_9GAMM|nr:LysR family transcriptional regulator [Halomonas organivorans]MBB3141929.1 DNA-binding transcriptional LysR family regulator [Halomonas organivorans]